MTSSSPTRTTSASPARTIFTRAQLTRPRWTWADSSTTISWWQGLLILPYSWTIYWRDLRVLRTCTSACLWRTFWAVARRRRPWPDGRLRYTRPFSCTMLWDIFSDLIKHAFKWKTNLIYLFQPLKVKCNEMTVKKLDDFFDKSTTADYMPAIRKLLDEAKSDSIEIVNLQLNKFREVNQMGKCHSQTSFSDL